MTNFEAILRILAPYIPSTADAVKVTERIMALSAPAPTPSAMNHDMRVKIALASDAVLDYMAANKKISAIKALRTEALCSLKEAKEAVEDKRVVDAAEARQDATLQALREKLTGETYVSCEHGLSADLCEGPNHYPDDQPF